jgi:heat-inducible transcriptional repressor
MSKPSFPGHLHREDPDLTDRQRGVLAALIALHGRSARPVGSDILSREGGFGLSAASIRNALAELKELDMVEQPHRAAGRLPTGRGYEYYVRTMVTPAALPDGVVSEVDRVLRDCRHDVERLLGEASRLLSSLTRQLGLALASSLEDEQLIRLDLEPLDECRVLMVLNLGTGAVRTLLLELDSPLEAAELREVAAVLRERLMGLTLHEVRERLTTDTDLARDSAVRLVVLAAGRSASWPSATAMFSAGAIHISKQPEFASAARVGSILDAVERGFPLDHLMVSTVEGHVAVRVGLDELQALSACSLVSYALPGGVCGAVGVLGPRRMDYAVTLAIVDAVGHRVADYLQS